MFWQENLPLSSLQVVDSRTLARVFNPNGRAQALSKAYLQTDIAGNSIGTVMEVPPKSIFTLAVGDSLLPRKNPGAIVRVANQPAWRVGANHGLPDQATIDLIKEKIDRLGEEIEKIEAEISRASPPDSYSLQHRSYALQRELVEYRLSARLNEIKLARGGRLDYDYLYQPDEEIAALGRALNQLRIKRRIYDYIVQAI
jgi:hypothetical protein